MFVYNIKLNKKLLLKLILGLMTIASVILMIVSGIKIFTSSKQEKDQMHLLDDTIPYSEVATIKQENYTNILKAVHDDLDTYIGQKISFTGYVYRLNSFKDTEFVLARDMDIGNKQTLIVGFLCSYDKAKDFPTYDWVKVTGEIIEGNYNGRIPLRKINTIEKTTKPEIPTVPLPDDTYVPTAVIY